tara:strand:- start:1631 stop:2437 length:807 start_codon:yes stop_codon:yes gene_type:complete
MNPHDRPKTLWITGDSFATFDASDGTHWLKQFAEHKGCERIFNLGRGGFDTKAICYVGKQILLNHHWPGRTAEQEFNPVHDILVCWGTSPDRVCHKSYIDSEFDYKIGIANLNWWSPGLVWPDRENKQEPMPWQEHMPIDTNLYSNNIGTMADYAIEEHPMGQDVEYIKTMLLYHDWKWEDEVSSHMYHGLYQLHESISLGSEMWLTGNVRQQRDGVNYLPCIGDYQEQGTMAYPEDYGTDAYNSRTLVNHVTPEEHNEFWQLLKPNL